MKVNIVCVGKIKEKFMTDAILEYSKRLSRFCAFNIIEVEEASKITNLEKKSEELKKSMEEFKKTQEEKINKWLDAQKAKLQKTQEEAAKQMADAQSETMKKLIEEKLKNAV